MWLGLDPIYFYFPFLPLAFLFGCVTFAPFPFPHGAMQTIQPSADVPLPFDLTDEQPKTHSDGVAVAVNTVDLIEQLGGSIDYSDEDLHKAANLITGAEKPSSPKHVSASSEAAATHRLVREFDFQAFSDALQARNFITNKLVKIANCGDTKLEIKALELLGKHSDIGLFTERSEITINHTSSTALENSIKERVKRLLGADVTDVPSLITELDTLEDKKSAKNTEKAPEEVQNPPETPENGPADE